MKNDKATREKLLASAKQEFMEKGYMQASLRSICKNAGVTTGALYFFFEDKEDLFASLVQEPLQKLFEVMNHHYADELTQASQLSNDSKEEMSIITDFNDDIEAGKLVVRYMFSYYEECQLLLTKAQGSRFEHVIDELVKVSEQHYRILTDQIAEQMKIPKVKDFMIHWMGHMTVDIFVHILQHEKSEEAALQYLEAMMKYLAVGWMELFRQ